MKVQINCKVENGTAATNRKAISLAFKNFEGKDITITLENKKKQRSSPQNRYYWGCILPIIKLAFLEVWGEHRSIEQVHEWAKMQFNFIEKVNEETGEITRIPKSTTENSTTDQETLHEEIRRFALDWFGVTVPIPNEQVEIEL